MSKHRAPAPRQGWVLLVLLGAGVLFVGGLSLAALAAGTPPRVLPGRTVIVPGPTTTVSYLLEKTTTVTPTP